MPILYLIQRKTTTYFIKNHSRVLNLSRAKSIIIIRFIFVQDLNQKTRSYKLK